MVDAIAPSEETKALTFTRDIHAPIEYVWSAFTNRDDASDWLSYDAMIRPEAGGYAIFTHYEGWHFYGAIKEVVENEKIVMTYQDGSDIGVTKLKIKFEDKGDLVSVTVHHKGLPEDKLEAFEGTWNTRLDALKGVLEDGAPPSRLNQVFIGIRPGGWDADRAKAMGLDLEYGEFVTDTIEGWGAHKAGLRANDLIVNVNGHDLSAEMTIGNALEGLIPKDVAPVVFYRDGNKQTLDMELGGIPMPDPPKTIAEMADYYTNIYADLDADLTAIIKDADDTKASKKPADDQWSAKETLAHLVLVQRHNRDWTSNYVEGPRRINGYQRSQGRIDALLMVYPTLNDLHEELRRKWQESIAMIRNLPEEVEARKNHLWWITFENAMSSYAPVLWHRQFDSMKALLGE